MKLDNTSNLDKHIHKYAREEHARKERAVIDYFLVSRRNGTYVENVTVERIAETGSDQDLLIMEINTAK